MRRAPLALVLALSLIPTGCGGDDEPAATKTVTVEQATTTSDSRPAANVSTSISGVEFDASAIYEKDAPGVVTVLSLYDQSAAVGGSRGAEGSGFVLNDKGEIATNAHVVTQGEGKSAQRAREVYVEFADGNRVEADIVGQDPNADVALLKIDPKGLTLRPLPLGSSADVATGSPVAAIGSPFGERQSLSVGVVSAVDRDIQSLNGEFAIPGAIQTDAAINPGNSGGPLVDAGGKVIGINQQIKTNSGGGEGVGFAVPVDIVKRSLGALRETGDARYAYLGVGSVPLYPQLVERFELPVEEGAWVQDVQPGSPAERAGIRGGRGEVRFQVQSYAQGGDIITRIEGKPIADANDLSAAVAQFQPGQEVTLELHRGGDTEEIAVELGERPLSAPGGGG